MENKEKKRRHDTRKKIRQLETENEIRKTGNGIRRRKRGGTGNEIRAVVESVAVWYT